MGGLGPGIGGFEILVIGLVALLVVGPKDLPMLMRKVGQVVGKATGEGLVAALRDAGVGALGAARASEPGSATVARGGTA